jgi:hypothetical protein
MRQYLGLKLTIEFRPGWATDVVGTSVVRGLRSLHAKQLMRTERWFRTFEAV